MKVAPRKYRCELSIPGRPIQVAVVAPVLKSVYKFICNWRRRDALDIAESPSADVSFFGNAGKKQRERWILDHWIATQSMTYLKIIESEGPDFMIDIGKKAHVGIEIVEVLKPGVRRHDLIRKIAQENLILAGPPESLKDVLMQAHGWIWNAIKKKAEKYPEDQRRKWVLIVYANYAWSSRTDWSAVRMNPAKEGCAFLEIWVLLANGEEAIRIP